MNAPIESHGSALCTNSMIKSYMLNPFYITGLMYSKEYNLVNVLMFD